MTFKNTGVFLGTVVFCLLVTQALAIRFLSLRPIFRRRTSHAELLAQRF
jgi:hypothetical protein